MAVAARYGIPRSQLLGREPTTTTINEYDEAGQLIRSVTTSEPRWLDEDLQWALAWMAEQADRCPGKCGRRLSETTAMADGEPVHSYHVPLPRRCWACDEIAKTQDAHEKKGKVDRPGALMWEVERVG